MGEYLVGAYLKMVEGCEYVDYNVHPPGGGLKGLAELDVVGFKFNPSVAYLCEVVTHILGLMYGDHQTTIQRIQQKFERQKQYAQERLLQFKEHRFMLWSPVVHEGYVTDKLSEIKGLELVIDRVHNAFGLDRSRDRFIGERFRSVGAGPSEQTNCGNQFSSPSIHHLEYGISRFWLLLGLPAKRQLQFEAVGHDQSDHIFSKIPRCSALLALSPIPHIVRALFRCHQKAYVDP